MEEQLRGVGDGRGPLVDPRGESAPTPLQTIFILVGLVPIVGGYLWVGSTLAVPASYMGFLFATCWGTVNTPSLSSFAPTCLGSLTGIALSYGLIALPALWGTAGAVLWLVALFAAFYLLIRRRAKLFFNPSFVIFLTIATIPALAASEGYASLTIGTLYGALYAALIFGLLKGFGVIAQSRARRLAVITEPS